MKKALLPLGLFFTLPMLLGNNGGGCGGGSNEPPSEVDSGLDAVPVDAASDAMVDADLADAPATECTVTISGGLSASDVCTGTSYQHFIQMNTTNVNIGFEAGGLTISASVIFDGDMRVGTFTYADAGMTGGIQVNQSQPPPLMGWNAEAAELGHGTIGSYTLSITSTIKLSTVGNNVNYAIHGTLSGSLVPVNPADPMNPPANIAFLGVF